MTFLDDELSVITGPYDNLLSINDVIDSELILFVSLLVSRPDWGLLAVACWTALSCLFHLVRLLQAYRQRARGKEIVSWLA